jgi:hypothetical protein
VLICAGGDIHRAIERFYDDVVVFEAGLGARFDWVLHVGEFGIWPDPEKSTAAHAITTAPGIFRSGSRPHARCPAAPYSSRETMKTSRGLMRRRTPRCCPDLFTSATDARLNWRAHGARQSVSAVLAGVTARPTTRANRQRFKATRGATIVVRKNRSGAGTSSYQRVFMMQPAENRFAADSIEFSATMSRRRLRADARDGGGARNARAQRHMRASAIVMSDPGFEGEAQMGFGQRDHPVKAFPANRANHAFANGIHRWTVRRGL